jgi:mono/diheme cytochrome c family protein
MGEISRLAGALTLVFLVLAAGCGKPEKTPILKKREVPRVLSEHDPLWIYNKHCASCHGKQLEGTEKGPALRGLRGRLDEMAILEWINRGKPPDMPANLVRGQDAFNLTQWLLKYKPEK